MDAADDGAQSSSPAIQRAVRVLGTVTELPQLLHEPLAFGTDRGDVVPRVAHNRGMTLRLLASATLLTAAAVTAYAQAPVPVTPDALVTAAKRAAGTDYAGTFLRICVAPDNVNAGGPRGGGPGPRVVPDRATWYAKPYKVFDNLYFIGTRIHSAWALTTSAGIIVIDTLFDYAIEPEMIEGMTMLGLDPRDIKYVLISHAHGDHDQGAALLQSR